jgi:hypothetical protein
MSERKIPYVGVSGVVNPAQQAEIHLEAGFDMRENGRRIGFGVKATHTPQWLDQPDEFGPKWYPVGSGDFQKALLNMSSSYNIAQMYLDPETLRTDPTYGQRFVEKVMQRGARHLDAIQFDMLPFDKDGADLSGSIAAVGPLDLIVQAHSRIMQNGPQATLEMIKRLTDEIEYVLFDASHGTGKTLDVEALKPFLDAAYNDPDFADFGTNFAIAGGLDAETVAAYLPELVREFPELSWDAEAKLHDRIQDGGDGSLNMPRVHQYMLSSIRALYGES